MIVWHILLVSDMLVFVEYVESYKSNVFLNDSCKNFFCSTTRNSLSNLHNSDVLDDPSKLSLFETYSNNDSLISNNDINFNNSSEITFDFTLDLPIAQCD